MIPRVLIVVGVLLLFSTIARAQPPLPIPSFTFPPPPQFVGAPAGADPIRGIPRVPQNPFMAANGTSEIHDTAWQSDFYRWGGPLGRNPQTLSSDLNRDCGSITFDRQGRVISICIGASGPQLYMFDPSTLETLATFMLPVRQSVPSNVFQDFTGGGYFYLDNQDRVVTGTTNQHIYVVAETPGSPGFTLAHDYDLTGVLRSGEKLTSQLPDSHGLLWFTAGQDGVVGTLSLSTGAVHVIRLGNGSDGEITKSLATDADGGVYIPTNHTLYRFVAGPGGVPRVSWQVTYPNDGIAKPGQLDAGTGTTPVLDGPYVGINDNEDPMEVVLYRTAVHPTRRVRRHGHWRRVALPRQVCRVPVFQKGQGADENAMIAAGRSYLIENNYGYQGPQSMLGGAISAAGFARIDVNRNGLGCRLVWTNTTEHVPSAVSQMSLANGLVYTYTTDSNGDWYWTALDYRTGKTVYKVYTGTGIGYNNNYAGIAISPKGTEYLGTLGGIIALRDGA